MGKGIGSEKMEAIAVNGQRAFSDTTQESDNVGRPYMTTKDRYKKEIEAYIQYLTDHGRTENTIYNYGKVLTCVLDYLYDNGRNCTSDTITSEDVRFYIETRDDLSDNTKKLYMCILDTFVKHHTGRTPFKDLDILWNRKTCKRLFISKEDYEKALAIAEPRERMILYFGAFMGLRAVEMARMRFSDIHGDTITLHGKGHGKNGYCVEATIPPKVREELNRYIQWRKSLEVKDESQDHVFFSFAKGKRIVPMDERSGALYRLIESTGKKAGVRITPHSLRRLFATTLYYDLSIDVVTIRELMRHSNINTTMQHYIQAYDSRKNDAIDRLNSYLGA